MLSEAKSACGGNEVEMLGLGCMLGMFFIMILTALLNRVTENWKRKKDKNGN